MVSTRAAILFVGYMAVVTFGYFSGAPPFRVDENEVVNLQVRWDTGWYLGIALGEYSYNRDRPQDQQNIVFFPALPVSIRVAGRLLRAPEQCCLAGLLICRIRSGCGYGIGSSNTALTTLKIAMLAPMPRASVTSAAAVNPGVRSRARTP